MSTHWECYSSIKMSMKHRVFIYGMLKSDNPFYFLTEEIITKGHAALLGKSRTEEKYPMVVSHMSTACLMDKPGYGKQIEGEVYVVDDEGLQILDDIEEVPTWYARKTILASTDGGCPEPTEIYVIQNYKEELLKQPMLSSFSYNDHADGPFPELDLHKLDIDAFKRATKK